MQKRSAILLATAAVSCGLSTGALAASLSSADRDFLTSTAQGARYELAVAKLALTKSASPDLKNYAHIMINDHKPLDARLHQVAHSDHVTLPTTMTSDKQQSYDHLSSLSGKAFDTAFVDTETSDNQADIGTEQKEISSTSNPQVKTLVERLQQADTKHAQIGAALKQSSQ